MSYWQMRDRRGVGKGFLPPPPGGPMRRDDRRYPSAPRERRRRSPSPGFHRGGSPPPFKRGRYGGRDDDPYGPRGMPHDGYYGRPSPPRERQGPRSYKDFCRTLPDDVTPEEAQKEYQQYLSEYWGSEVKADFESKKNEEWMKRRFDPRGMRKAMEDRNQEARQSAEAFLQDIKSGALDPKADNFNQGAAQSPTDMDVDGNQDAADEDDAVEPAEGEEKPKGSKESSNNNAQEVCWLPSRLANDLQLSQQLIRKLDEEKGIAENTLLPKASEPSPAEDKAATPAPKADEEIKVEDPEASKALDLSDMKPTEAPEGTADGDKAVPDPEVKAEDADMTEPSGAEPAVEAEEKMSKDADMPDAKGTVESEASPKDASTAANGFQAHPSGPEDIEETIRKLDIQLTYLWKVHAVDFYAGKENADPMSFALRTSTERRIRGPRPEEGEQSADLQAEKKALKQVEKHIDQVWKKRLVAGDPFAALLQEEKAERLLDEWVNDQVKKIDDKKWGCKLSQKLFVGRDYVLKHIRLKHQEKVEEQKSKILDDVFWENYKKFREEEKKLMQAELEKMQQTISLQKNGLPWEGQGPNPMAGAAAMGGGVFPGSMRLGGGMPGMLAGAMMPQPGQVLVLAPGAGPMGPFISVPIAEAGGYGRMGRGAFPRGPPPRGMAGRGGRGYGPPPMGPMAPVGGRGGGRGYFDLDNPTNNRSVLDYGDL